MIISIQPQTDIIVASSTIPVDAEHIHHLRVVLDGARAEEVYSFLWATTDSESEPLSWGEHWRGNLAACMRHFSEVAEDMMAETAKI